MSQRVKIAMLNLGLDPAEAEDWIHEETSRYLLGQGREDLLQPVKKVARTPGQYVSGAKAAFLTWWRESPIFALIRGKAERGERVFVDAVEGNRRAVICGKCDRNVIPAGKGWVQNWTDGKMLEAVEGRRTENHDRLGVCEVCSCELRAAVWWSPDIIEASSRRARYATDFPKHCWKRQIINP